MHTLSMVTRCHPFVITQVELEDLPIVTICVDLLMKVVKKN